MASDTIANLADRILRKHYCVGDCHGDSALVVVRLFRALRAPAKAFNAAKGLPVLALTLSLLMWLVAFLTVGAEWFLMWQSHTWNGQEAAFRMFVIVGIVLVIMLQPDTEGQP